MPCKFPHPLIKNAASLIVLFLMFQLTLFTTMAFFTPLQLASTALDNNFTGELSWRFYRGSLARTGIFPTHLPPAISSVTCFKLSPDQRFPELSLYSNLRLQEPKYYDRRIYFIESSYLCVFDTVSHQLHISPLFKYDTPIYALGRKLSDIVIESMLIKEAMIYNTTVVTVYIIHGCYKVAHQMLSRTDIIGVSFHSLDGTLEDVILVSLDYIPGCYRISDCEYAIVNYTVVIYPVGRFWVSAYNYEVTYSLLLIKFNSFGQVTYVSTISFQHNVEKMSYDDILEIIPSWKAHISPKVPILFKGKLISVIKEYVIELHITDRDIEYTSKEIFFEISSYHMLAYDGFLYAISGDYILRLDDKMNIVSRIKLKAPIETNLCRFIINGSVIYILAQDYLVKLSMEDGTLLWRVKLIPGKHLIQSATLMLLEEIILYNDAILVSLFSLPFEGIIAVAPSDGTPKYYYSIDCLAGAIAVNGAIYAVATPSIKQGVEFNILYVLKH